MSEFTGGRYQGPSFADTVQVRVFAARSLTIGTEWVTRNVLSSYWRLYRNQSDGAALIVDDAAIDVSGMGRESVRLGGPPWPPADPTGGAAMTARLGPSSAIYPLVAGRLHLVPAGVRFSCRATGSVPHLFVHFDVIGLADVTRRELFGQPVTLPTLPLLEAEAVSLTEPLSRAEPLGLAEQCRVKALVYQSLAAYWSDVPADQLARCRRLATEARVRPALEWIDDHLTERLTNRDLADLCCVCEDHFIRLFRTHLGQTPAQYVRERRLLRAAQELLFTDRSIDQIAARTGFGSRSYFTRAFTGFTGQPPGAYRQTQRV